jgi:dipeptidyl-peptidase-4
VTTTPVTFTAADGKTTLYGTLTLPAASGTASTPLILNPYGGPLPTAGARNSWNGGRLFDELLAQHGFAVLQVDNRGSGGRGRDFQQAAYHTFGPVQFADQMAALDQTLARNPQLDPKRIGWWGWSWGGSFTLYAMTHTDRIRAGVAVAPVTDWHNYDSIYTERYLGLPSGKPDDSYTTDSPVTHAADLKGRLLLAQGTGDDNVHLANTIQFIEPLINAGIPYDLQLFPRKTHSIAGTDARNELFNRILSQFETYLK